ncbi:MAG TPA: hypothetical protein PLS53_00165 [Thermoanaerobaculaceae bacterium]|nr:hypothetical protein [Thermoanaerobaculaceae bacterium]
MSTNAVSSVNSTQGGERRILSGAAASAVIAAASSSTEAAIAPDALLEQWENDLQVAFGLRADGRLVVPVQVTDPAVLHDGDFWIGLNLGLPELRYRMSGVTYVLGGSGGSGPTTSGLSLPCLTNGLKKGVAVRTLDSGGMKCDVAGVGVGSVAGGLYRAVGVINADVSGATPVEILMSGMRIDLTGPQIDFLTGGSTGVLVPTRRYFVSVSGRWSVTPLLEAGAEVVVPLGVAMTTTNFLVQIGPAVIL